MAFNYYSCLVFIQVYSDVFNGSKNVVGIIFLLQVSCERLKP